MSKPIQEIVKTYPMRGPMSQFRFDSSLSFICFRCKSKKTSKLISIYRDDWNLKLCNGCYGCLISLYEIKSGMDPDEKRFLALDKSIANIWKHYNKKLSKIEKEISKKSHYEATTNKFLATAEFLKQTLPEGEFLEWSPAVICLCKAVENELINKFILPLKQIAITEKIIPKDYDKRTQRLEKYIFGLNGVPPEIGSIAFFSELIAKSQSFRNTSSTFVLIKFFSEKRPLSSWLYSENGAHLPLQELVGNFRNNAAHIKELTKKDYLDCEELTLGSDGVLVKVLQSSAVR